MKRHFAPSVALAVSIAVGSVACNATILQLLPPTGQSYPILNASIYSVGLIDDPSNEKKASWNSSAAFSSTFTSQTQTWATAESSSMSDVWQFCGINPVSQDFALTDTLALAGNRKGFLNLGNYYSQWLGRVADMINDAPNNYLVIDSFRVADPSEDPFKYGNPTTQNLYPLITPGRGSTLFYTSQLYATDINGNQKGTVLGATAGSPYNISFMIPTVPFPNSKYYPYVGAHEFGHTLGLADDPNSADVNDLMYYGSASTGGTLIQGAQGINPPVPNSECAVARSTGTVNQIFDP